MIGTLGARVCAVAKLAGVPSFAVVKLATAPIAVAALTVAPLGPAPCPVAEDSGSPELRALYQGGQSYDEFFAQADRRKEQWESNYGRAEIPSDVLARARGVGGTWYILSVSVAGCSDSVNTVPYVARLVAEVEGLDMRIVDSRAGLSVMESHRTPDLRAATPTFLLLNSDFEEVGCFIERPRTLRDWYLENQGTMNRNDLFVQKMAWYDEDAGLSTVGEMVDILEAAAAGEVICGG